MLHEMNPYIDIYKTAAEYLQAAENAGLQAQVVLNLQMHLIMYSCADQRCENLPTSEEVAIVIPDEYGQSCFCDIVLHLYQILQQGSAFS